MTFSSVQGGIPGNGNLAVDLRFADAAQADYHLLATSPCIDAGSPVPGLLSTDFEGDPRVAFGGPDLGAPRGHRVARCRDRSPFLGRPGEAAFWLLATATNPGIPLPDR